MKTHQGKKQSYLRRREIHYNSEKKVTKWERGSPRSRSTLKQKSLAIRQEKRLIGKEKKAKQAPSKKPTRSIFEKSKGTRISDRGWQKEEVRRVRSGPSGIEERAVGLLGERKSSCGVRGRTDEDRCGKGKEKEGHAVR